VVALLLAGLVGLGVWYGSLAPAPSAGDYPGPRSLAADYDGHVGERVEVPGRAVETDPLVVESGGLRLAVTGLDRSVETGDVVWVYGVLEPRGQPPAGTDGRVEAVDAVVISPGEFRYGRGISVLAGLWVLGRILQDWRIDRETLGLAPAPSGGWPVLSGALSDGEDQSAEEGPTDA
jgi:hypothetical protein